MKIKINNEVRLRKRNIDVKKREMDGRKKFRILMYRFRHRINRTWDK